MKLETRLIHAGGESDSETGAVAPPIHLSTTFEHPPDASRIEGHTYVRQGNPTQDRLEDALAACEGGDDAVFYASGLAAAAALLQSLDEGSHVLFPRDVYHGVRELAHEYLPRWGCTFDDVEMEDLDQVAEAVRPETRLIWAETPSNPLLQISDLEGLSGLARDAGALLLADNTFATPILQHPLEHGADLVLHSATKYMGGHSDVQGGALILGTELKTELGTELKTELSRDAGAGPPLAERLRAVRTRLGAVASPFNAWLVLRGLRSMACRVERHAENALAVAEMLADHEAVVEVYYPGLPSHPGHHLAMRQMRAFGGMVAFRVDGGRAAALDAAGRLRLFRNATSLGGAESLVEHRASMEGPDSPTPDDLLRLSVGLEHADDLIADLQHALGP